MVLPKEKPCIHPIYFGITSFPTTIINNNFNDVFFRRLRRLLTFDQISFSIATIKWDASFSSILLDLIIGTSTEGICANQGRFPTFFLVIICQFCTRRGLSRTLQTDKHDYVGFSSLRLVGFDTRIDQLNQFLRKGHKI